MQERRARRTAPSARLDESTNRCTMNRPIRERVLRHNSFKAGREGGRWRGEGGMWVRRKWRSVTKNVKDWVLWRRNDMKMDWEDRSHR